MTRQNIPDEIKHAVETQMQKCSYEDKRKEPLNRLYSLYLFCSEKYSRKKIAELLGKPRHTVETWIHDLAKATPEQIVAIARCKYTLLDIYNESGRCVYEKSLSDDSDKVIMARKEIYSILFLSGINETCFVTPDDKIYLNEDGKNLICDMLMNRVKRDPPHQKPSSYAAYSDIRNGHFCIKHRKHYDWMLEMACSNLRDISAAYPDKLGNTEYYTENEIRLMFWRHACLVNQNYNVLPGMSLLGELPDDFYKKTHEAILDDIITTFDPLIVGEFSGCDCKKLEYMGQFMKQRWIEYLYCVSDIRDAERQRIFKELELCPGLRIVVEMIRNIFLSTYDWDSYRKRTKSQDIKWGSSMKLMNKEKLQSWESFIISCKKKPEDRTEGEHIFLALIREAGEHCAKIYHLMPIEEVIELADKRLQGEEPGSAAECAATNA